MNKWYNNADHTTNGEMLLWDTIKSDINVMFDVGCKTDTYYIEGDAIQYHLFEPYPMYYDIVKSKLDNKRNVIVNNIGYVSGNLEYFLKAESFVNRFNESVCKYLPLMSLADYVKEKNVKHIDFLKIDTEGFEIDVLKGAGSFLNNITHIQFEYGGTYPDRGVKLADVYNILRTGYEIFLIGSDGLYRKDPEEHLQYSNYFATRNTKSVTSIIRQS